MKWQEWSLLDLETFVVQVAGLLALLGGVSLAQGVDRLGVFVGKDAAHAATAAAAAAAVVQIACALQSILVAVAHLAVPREAVPVVTVRLAFLVQLSLGTFVLLVFSLAVPARALAGAPSGSSAAGMAAAVSEALAALAVNASLWLALLFMSRALLKLRFDRAGPFVPSFYRTWLAVFAALMLVQGLGSISAGVAAGLDAGSFGPRAAKSGKDKALAVPGSMLAALPAWSVAQGGLTACLALAALVAACRFNADDLAHRNVVLSKADAKHLFTWCSVACALAHLGGALFATLSMGRVASCGSLLVMYLMPAFLRGKMAAEAPDLEPLTPSSFGSDGYFRVDSAHSLLHSDPSPNERQSLTEAS